MLGRQPWLILLLIVAAFIFAMLATGRGPDRETHEAILTSLRAVDVNNASLQRDVLQSRYGMLENYDPLVTSVMKLHKAVTDLRHLLQQSDAAGDGHLQDLLHDLDVSIMQDDDVVERFKTDNSQLQNSLEIFNRALTSLNNGDDLVPRNLGNEMMHFSMRPTPDLSSRIYAQLQQIAPEKPVRGSDVWAVLTHGSVILKGLPSVDMMVSNIQASQTSPRAQALQGEYLKEFGRLTARAAWSRIYLGSVSFALCGYVASLIYKLRRQTETLKQKLTVEAALANLTACFKDSAQEDFGKTVRTAIDLMMEQLAGASYQLSTLHAVSGELEHEYASDGTIIPVGGLLWDQLSTALRNGINPAHFIKAPPQSLIGGSATRCVKTSFVVGMVVGIAHSNRLSGILAFKYVKPRSKPGKEEIAFVLAMLQVIVSNIELHQNRTEREVLQRRVDHAERLQAVGTLAGGIAHEFNNILGAMLGYAELAQHSLKRKSPLTNYVQQIISAGERAKKIIDQILALSRKRRRTTKPIDIVEVLHDIEPLLQISLRSDLELLTSFPANKAVVFGNPVEIQQIAMNLCKNAAEAIVGPGTIHIEVDIVQFADKRTLSHSDLPSGRWVRLSVKDSGSGIPEEVLPHIFEPFFTTRPHDGGTGLGLAAVHGHVTALSGYIDVESKKGIGTRFRIYLPSCGKPAVPLSEFFKDADVPVGAGELVGILEQDDNVRMMYEEKVAALGYEPMGFKNSDALASWFAQEQEKLDVLLVDASLLRSFMKSEAFSRLSSLPYVVLTERGRGEPNAYSELKGAEFLKKPIGSKDLATAIRSAMSIKIT